MQSDGFNSALSPVVYGDIGLSINTHYKKKLIKPILVLKLKMQHQIRLICDVILGGFFFQLFFYPRISFTFSSCGCLALNGVNKDCSPMWRGRQTVC